VDDPITGSISGRDFAQLAAECEDITVEIYEFYKQTFPEGLMAMVAIPSDLVLIEDRYYCMKRKKNRFEQTRARMLAFQKAPPPFQNAPPLPFQVQNAPRAAVASNEKRSSPSEQSAPPPPAVKERTKEKQLRIERCRGIGKAIYCAVAPTARLPHWWNARHAT
jgi:hypothetical protein